MPQATGIIKHMANMIGMARQGALQREEVPKIEIQKQTASVRTNMLTLQKDAAGTAVQVGHLTNAVTSFANQLYTNADFTVDAVQQVRDVLNGRIDALTALIPASNAGGRKRLFRRPVSHQHWETKQARYKQTLIHIRSCRRTT